MAHDPVFNEDKKKIKIVQPKAADPGFAFFLETEDGTPFGSALNIVITITDDTVTPVSSYITKIEVTNHVYESKLPILAPFGDQSWLNPSILMKEIPYKVEVEFCDATTPYTSDALGKVMIEDGAFEISIKDLAGPQTAFSYIIKGLKMLFGLEKL